MMHLLFVAVTSTAFAFASPEHQPEDRAPRCRCAPHDKCWPSTTTWGHLNTTVGGQLIATEPLAISCYLGPQQDAADCTIVDNSWTSNAFHAADPIGLSYPTNITCPPVNASAGETPGNCTLGSNPVYAINATKTADVVAGVRFARAHNVRLVVKSTGHDILGRSDGYGSLEVWLRNLRNGIHFRPSYQSTCKHSRWQGSAMRIGGGYTFADVYPVAEANNVVVVGGGTPSVGVLGGWMQGGGHGPASRQFGLGADQVLQAQVVLADGSVVTASPCENQDLFFAVRGGGPGTYGVVVSAVIKAWPNVDAQVQHVAIAPLAGNTNALLDAISILFAAYPDLNDAGYAGYGSWSTASPTPLFADAYAGYVHGFYTFNQSLKSAKAAFAPALSKLLPYNGTSLSIIVSYTFYPGYWSFYKTESGVEPPVGSESALGSRLFSRASVADHASLRSMVNTIAGKPEEYTSNNFELVSGGQVFADAADPLSGVNPAWRMSYFNNIVARGWAPGTAESEKAKVREDITHKKVVAMKLQSPDTGAYMNEADRLDPSWAQDFYGAHYGRLLEVKHRQDPEGVFYCPTCVGSAAWAPDASGRLCRVQS